MSDVVIRVKNLSKQYRIGGAQESYKTLRESISQFVRLKRNQASQSHFWALQNVSFEVNRGEVIGVIGRNGAGKSTLLKVLSRITEPTEGAILIKGRIGSLLEVGTGFHPELTGRENIYLNGSILGMRREHIRRRFDEIVEFAEVAQFIDTPVKRYSSGMYLRLAFSVAAHLEPEILVVDEVLAVGDAAFQKKCLGKMEQVAGAGRTVLFVSHSMASIQALCTQCLLLEGGQVKTYGAVAQTIEDYLASNTAQIDTHNLNLNFILSLETLNAVGESSTSFQIGAPIRFKVTMNTRGKANLALGIAINTILGVRVATFITRFQDVRIKASEANHVVDVECEVVDLKLIPGMYGVKLAVAEGMTTDVESVELTNVFEIVATDLWGHGVLPHASQGFVLANHRWNVSSRESIG